MGGKTDLTVMQRPRTLAPTLVVAYVAGLARSAVDDADPTAALSYERDLDAVRTAARELRESAACLRGDPVAVRAEVEQAFSSTFGASRTLGAIALQALGLTSRGKTQVEAADSEVMATTLDDLAAQLDEFADGDRRNAERISTVFSSMARLATTNR